MVQTQALSFKLQAGVQDINKQRFPGLPTSLPRDSYVFTLLVNLRRAEVAATLTSLCDTKEKSI